MDKKAARRERQRSEGQAKRDLDEASGEAISEALRLAPEVADASSADVSESAIDVDFASIDAAKFASKRVNEALSVGEWLDVVRVWVWDAKTHTREPLSDRGSRRGYELRIEQAR